MTQPHHIIAIAREMLGVRFAHQGRNAAEGLDCLGFLLVVAERAGIRFHGKSPWVHDRRDYGAKPDTLVLQSALARALTPVDKKDTQLADILLLYVANRPQHLALITDYKNTEFGMIHAYAPARKVVEHHLDARWQQAIARVYRLPIFIA